MVKMFTLALRVHVWDCDTQRYTPSKSECPVQPIFLQPRDELRLTVGQFIIGGIHVFDRCAN